MIDKISFSIFGIEIFLKTMEELYRISYIVYYIYYIFYELILYCQVFYLKEIWLVYADYSNKQVYSYDFIVTAYAKVYIYLHLSLIKRIV